MALSEFSSTLGFIPGVENDIADAMSHLCRNNMVDLPQEYFEEHILSAISASTKPNKSQIAKIGNLHNSKVGHFELESTIERFEDRKDVWQFQRQHIRHFIDECACCQKMSMLKIPIHAHGFTTFTYTPMECLNIDFILTKDIPSSSYAQSHVGWSYTGLLMLRHYLLQNIYYNILVASAYHVR